MRNRLISMALAFMLMLSLAVPALGAEPAPVEVKVDGVAVADARTRTVDGSVYASLYFVTLALRPDAVVEWKEDRLVATAPDFTLSAKIGDSYLNVNGRYLYLPDGVLKHDTGDTLIPVRTLARGLGAEVSWDGAVLLKSGGKPLLSGDKFYNATDVDLLARVIFHESGNQPLAGQIGVGNVILNRVASPRFPNSVSGVINQPNQFYNATCYAPSARCVLVAKLCLDGAVTVPNAYWFNGAGIACWASRNKTHIATIGGHAFYG